MVLAASIGHHLAGTTEEQPTQQRLESLARSGRTLNPMSTSKHSWAITTFAGILLEVVLIKCGALPQIPTLNWSIVRFPSALL